jgi:hypothetical protein
MAVILTCEIEGCGNANIGIYFEGEADRYLCGVCMNDLTNKGVASSG